MPNYVRNWVCIDGEKDEVNFAKSVLHGMDFNKITPMKETLNIISGSDTAYGCLAYLYAEYKDNYSAYEKITNELRALKILFQSYGISSYSEKIPEMMEYLSSTPAEGEVNRSQPFGSESADTSYLYKDTDNHPKVRADYVALGRIFIENCRETGFGTWYEWCRYAWGTKWNALDVSIAEEENHLVFCFNTAWNMPERILQKIEFMLGNTNLQIIWAYADENAENEGVFLKGCNSTEFDEYEISNPDKVWHFDIDTDVDYVLCEILY